MGVQESGPVDIEAVHPRAVVTGCTSHSPTANDVSQSRPPILLIVLGDIGRTNTRPRPLATPNTISLNIHTRLLLCNDIPRVFVEFYASGALFSPTTSIYTFQTISSVLVDA